MKILITVKGPPQHKPTSVSLQAVGQGPNLQGLQRVTDYHSSALIYNRMIFGLTALISDGTFATPLFH